MSTYGRRALITGASRGIGRELALGLAGRGWAVGLTARSREALDRVAAECREHGVAACVAVADVVDRPSVEQAVRAVVAELGGVDLLVNNAGVVESVEADFHSADVDETWRVVEVNVRGPMLVTHAVLGTMLDAGGGRIVNMNSGAAHDVRTVYTGYTVGKGALARFTTQLDAQFSGRGIRTFDLSPGVVKTDMTASMPMHTGRTEWTAPEDVVELVAAIGNGRLDDLGGRYVRAGVDTIESLLMQTAAILDSNARVLRLAPIGADDPAV
ncbi:MAG TPA: SDR family oxidoreductase [Jiangellaceae bacterium]|nr:SDR family oxidoreductase [Jiangellaceae bacterium]